jgi:hypothetical protein
VESLPDFTSQGRQCQVATGTDGKPVELNKSAYKKLAKKSYFDCNSMSSVGGVGDAGDPAGDYTNQTDIDGEQRVLYDNVDIGADEVFPIAGDIDQDGDVDFDDFAYFTGHWLKGK